MAFYDNCIVGENSKDMLHTERKFSASIHKNQYQAARSRLNGSNWHPPPKSADHRRRGAEVKQFVLTIRSSWRSSRGLEIFIEPPRFFWCGWPVSRLHRKILLMHPWDTYSTLATSRWKLPSANNLIIRCNICSGKFCGMIPFKSSMKYQ